MPNPTIKQRLSAIRWDHYTHPCHPSSAPVPALIHKLFDSHSDYCCDAANELWNLVAHQGNVGSNSVPTLPFLIDRIKLDPPLLVLQELTEIIFYFSQHLEPPDTDKWSALERDVARCSFNYPDDYQWTHLLRSEMHKHTELFRELADHPDKDVAGYAEMILKNLHKMSSDTGPEIAG